MSRQHSSDYVANAWSEVHPITPEDATAMAALRIVVTPNKGLMQGIAARDAFDAIMERVEAPEAVTFEQDIVGGISGLWCKPENARPGEVVLHIHGGWFNWGSARAFRHLVGHIASQAGVEAFVPDYRLAPEHPFPAAPEDVRACYLGLVERDFSRIAVTGDSAGGNLALGLLASLATATNEAKNTLAGAVALSPVTDLAQSGEAWETRADADPYFLKTQAEELIRCYLSGHDPSDPAASPLFADLSGLPPIRVHVGNDEVLLDDSVRFVEQAVAAGVDAHLDVWEGMVHGFLGGVGRLKASSEALRLIGEFLRKRLMAE